jgi:hypothetical protein
MGNETLSDALRGLLALLFVVALQVLLSIGIMTYGWGLTPRSWWWIVGGGVIGVTALRSLADKINSKDKSVQS